MRSSLNAADETSARASYPRCPGSPSRCPKSPPGRLEELAIVCEETAAQGCPLLLTLVSAGISGEVLTAYGTPEQKQRWLPGPEDLLRRLRGHLDPYKAPKSVVGELPRTSTGKIQKNVLRDRYARHYDMPDAPPSTPG